MKRIGRKWRAKRGREGGREGGRAYPADVLDDEVLVQENGSRQFVAVELELVLVANLLLPGDMGAIIYRI